MRQLLNICILVLLCCVFFSGRNARRGYAPGGSRQVAISVYEGKYRVYRNGAPYYIKGANVTGCRYLADIKAAGGNSVRLYNTDSAQQVLDSAYKLGMTVTVGLSMGYAARDMSYGDRKAVATQLEKLRAQVLRFRNHPALLLWGVGNENNLFLGDGIMELPEHIRLCKAINDVAKMVHGVDPNHPAVLMVSGGSTNRMNAFFCDDVDLIAYNSFESITWQLSKSCWQGPYIVSEYGQLGYWVSPKTEWYNFSEQTSFEKAQFMRRQYEAFLADSANCLGSYAFLWGQKQEYTSTWFSLYTDRGEKTDLVEELQALWNGLPSPAGTAHIRSVRLNDKADVANIYLPAGKTGSVTITLSDTVPAHTALRWEIQSDNVQYLDASYSYQKQRLVKDSSLLFPGQQHAFTFSFTAPPAAGPYRLFVYLSNGENKVSTANACFYVFD